MKSIRSNSFGHNYTEDVNYIWNDTMKIHEITSTAQPSSFMGTQNKNKLDNCMDFKYSKEEICEVELDTVMKLKDSTRKLLCLLEEIESKMQSKDTIQNHNQILEFVKPIPNFQDEEDNCTIYKKLTRKCTCLHQNKYNDFIIHFNEDTKHFTSNIGEIIKNMRILKKFLYMGGNYTRNALMFLNEGLSESSQSEKAEIIQACSHADICNVFEDTSIVKFCISLPFKYESYGDLTTQALASEVLHKLAIVEEGKRYLKFSTKIMNEIKRVMTKMGSKFNFDTLDNLNATLNILQPAITQENVTYYCKPIEGFGMKTLKALLHHRQYMTLEEIFTHLALLQQLSNKDVGKSELMMYLPTILSLFKNLLMQYDNSEINILVTHILNNIVSKNMVKENDFEDKLETISNVNKFETNAHHVKMKSVTVQTAPKKIMKKTNKSKTGITTASNRFKQVSKRKAESRNRIIIVPIEK